MPVSKNPHGQEQAMVSKALSQKAGKQVDVWIRGLGKKIFDLVDKEVKTHIGKRNGQHGTLDIILAALLKHNYSTDAFEINSKGNSDETTDAKVAVIDDLIENRIQVLVTMLLRQLEEDQDDEEYDFGG